MLYLRHLIIYLIFEKKISCRDFHQEQGYWYWGKVKRKRKGKGAFYW